MCLHVCVHVCADIPVSACDHASRGQRATLVKPSHVVFFQLRSFIGLVLAEKAG